MSSESLNSKTTVETNPFTELSTGFLRDLMTVVASFEKPPSGQDIKERLETNGYDQVNHGRLYPNLDTLVHKGLVNRGEMSRRTNYYVLTEKGERALERYEAWVSDGQYK